MRQMLRLKEKGLRKKEEEDKWDIDTTRVGPMKEVHTPTSFSVMSSARLRRMRDM
jgi:hypothetical protein